MYTILYSLHCKNVHLSPWIRYVSSIFQNSGSNYVWLTQDCNRERAYKKHCLLLAPFSTRHMQENSVEFTMLCVEKTILN